MLPTQEKIRKIYYGMWTIWSFNSISISVFVKHVNLGWLLPTSSIIISQTVVVQYIALLQKLNTEVNYVSFLGESLLGSDPISHKASLERKLQF